MEEIARPFVDHRLAAATLAAALPAYREGRLQILSARVAQSRRRISRRLLREGGMWLGVVWQLQVRDGVSGECGEQWLYGRFYHGPAPLAEWTREAAGAGCVPRFGQPVALLPDAGLVLWALPNDPVISALGTFLDPLAAAAHVPTSLRPDDGTRVVARIVRHEPEEHCTARFQVIHEGCTKALYGKCYADGRWRDARDGLDALWRHAGRDPLAFTVGRPLGASPALGALWQEEVQGRPLAAELRAPHGKRLVVRLADALYRLQRAGPRQGRREPPAESVGLARKWHKKLELADAALAEASAPVLARLATPPLRSTADVTVHGDFHVDQMLWTGERIALFDYDNFAIGSPLRDLADCISQLLCRQDEGDWRAIAGGLLGAYRTRIGDAFDEADFDWHLRLMLMRKAYSFMVRAREGWRGASERALRLAIDGRNALPPKGFEVAA
ncbi:MAG: phosphotransferase [Rhodocyclaceae bacterium]|nr:phosphotransferase [Rhodocyclaceae bacterium]